MGQGYIRNDTANNIADGNVADAADIDGEFDAIVDAFHETTGHTHGGGGAEGAPITVVGPAQEYLGDGTSFYPKLDATYDLGKISSSFNLAYLEGLNLAGTTITATATELNYVGGVTSAIQTQLNNKQPLDSDLTAIAALAKTDGNFIVGNGTAWVTESGATVRSSLGLGTAATTASTDYATAAQGSLADSATQPGDNISTLVNNSNFVASGANISVFTNDSNYISIDSTTLTGTTQSLNVGSFNLFDAAITADTTLSFASVPTEARWTYTVTPPKLAPDPTTLSGPIASSGLVTNPDTLHFTSDGKHLFTCKTGLGTVYSFPLGIPWDITTLKRFGLSFNSSGSATNPHGIQVKPDGSRAFVACESTGAIYQYDMSTNFDASSMSYSSISLTYSGDTGAASARDIVVKPDGLTLLLFTLGDVWEYTLSTAWDLSTASYSTNTFDFGALGPDAQDVHMDPDGDWILMLDATSESLHKLTLSTSWDVSTIAYSSSDIGYFGNANETAGSGLSLKTGGQEIVYFAGETLDSVESYHLKNTFDITLPSSVAGKLSTPIYYPKRGTFEFYTADGGTTVKLIGETYTEIE